MFRIMIMLTILMSLVGTKLNGLLWTVGLNVELIKDYKAVFSNSPPA